MFKFIIYVCFASIITTDVTQGRILNFPVIPSGIALHNVLSTWKEAYEQCRKEGAILASPINEDVYNSIYESIKATRSTFHIGTKASGYPGQFVSLEGVPLENMTVASWQEIDPWKGDCLAISFDGTVRVDDCESRLPYICLNRRLHQNRTNCGPITKGYKYNEPTGNCYKGHEGGKKWDEAQSTCETEGANLAIIKNSNEARSIIELEGFTHIRMSIGIKQSGAGDWKTFYGQPVEELYNDWMYGYKPNNSAYHCGSMHIEGKLDDINCEGVLPFICQKAPTF